MTMPNYSSPPPGPRRSNVYAPLRRTPPTPHPLTPQPAAAAAAAPSPVVPPPTPVVQIPNIPSPASLAHGTGSDLTVTWADPSIDTTHSAAIGFALRFSPSGAGTWTTVSSVRSPYDLAGLPAGVAIDVQLQGLNAAGASAWSSTSTLTTASDGSHAPDAPTITGVTPPPDGSNSKLTVTWTAPAADGTHGAAAAFNVRSGPAGAGTWTVVSGVNSPYTLTGLAGATAIDVEVQAANAAGSAGTWSAATTATTWGIIVAQGGWTAAATQVHGTAVGPSGGVQMTATAAPTAVSGASFGWSGSATTIPTTGLIAAGSDGQPNGWGQWFDAPATPGVFYLWLLAQGPGGATSGALVTAAITVS